MSGISSPHQFHAPEVQTRISLEQARNFLKYVPNHLRSAVFMPVIIRSLHRGLPGFFQESHYDRIRTKWRVADLNRDQNEYLAFENVALILEMGLKSYGNPTIPIIQAVQASSRRALDIHGFVAQLEALRSGVTDYLMMELQEIYMAQTLPRNDNEQNLLILYEYLNRLPSLVPKAVYTSRV